MRQERHKIRLRHAKKISMNDRQKQILLLVVGLLFVSLLLFVGYYYFFKTPAATEPAGLIPNTSQGGGLPTSVPTQTRPSGTGSGTEAEPTLFQIHEKPLVSFVIFVRGASTFARYIEQGSGHVYEYNFDAKQEVRVSNTSIPYIQTASWAKDGNTVAFQYLEGGSIRTAVGELATTSTEGSYKKITFLPAGLMSVALSPSGDEVVYATLGQTGGVVGIVKKDGTKPRVVFTSPLTRFLVSWPSAETVLIETPLSEQGGAAFSLNTKTGTSQPIIKTQGPFTGLVGSSDGFTYLYSPSWSKGTTRYNSKNNTEFALFAMNTVPDKCSFVATSTDYAICGSGSGPSAAILNNLEAWLRGEGNTEDSIYIVSFNKGYWTPPIKNEDLGDRVFDVEHIEADARFAFAAFKEKKDGSLWGIRLGEGLFK